MEQLAGCLAKQAKVKEGLGTELLRAGQSDRQRTGSPYVHIQIYLHVTTVNFKEIIGFRKLQLCTRTCCISYISETVKAICTNI